MVEASIPRRTVVLKGTVAQMNQAFQSSTWGRTKPKRKSTADAKAQFPYRQTSRRLSRAFSDSTIAR